MRRSRVQRPYSIRHCRFLVWLASALALTCVLGHCLRKAWQQYISNCQTYDYDLFIIGGGSGGIRAATASSQLYGAKVALAELPFGLVSTNRFVPGRRAAGGVGGTCVIRGCIPKKLLVFGSQVRPNRREASAYGWWGGRPWHSWSRLMRHKNAVIKKLNRKFEGNLESSSVKFHEGRAKVLGPHMVEVNGKQITARYICVATGSSASVPDFPGVRLPGVITSDEALVLSEKPRRLLCVEPCPWPMSWRLVIVGGGYIALEFASFFRSYGTKVHVVARKTLLLHGFDEDVRSHVTQLLSAKGVRLHMNTNVISIERSMFGGLEVTTDEGKTLRADAVLLATGRTPNSANLGLDEVGVATAEDRRVLVNKYSQTSVPSIYAVGDVTGRLALTPAALREAEALAKTLFGGKSTYADHELVPKAIFSQPPIATCGLTETQAAQRFGSVDVYLTTFTPLKHSMPTRREKEEQILMKMLVVSDGFLHAGRVVGVHMVGAEAPEIVQGLAVAMKAGAKKDAFDQTQAIHPTTAEEWCLLRDKNRTTLGRDVSGVKRS